jgi:predicted Zn-dependent protease
MPSLTESRQVTSAELRPIVTFMSQDRIPIFESMARDQPDNVMVWYGLASEYAKQERWSEAATALQKVVEINPDYTAAYQMLGTALLNLGNTEGAAQAWSTGIVAAERTGAWKARDHMKGLMAGIRPESDFCTPD